MNNVDISIVMLTYNQENYIEQALDSILNQKTRYSYEIIVGDDCSTDKTPQILQEYGKRYPDKFVLVLRNKNLGACHNYYDLLMRAKGKYIAQLEGDDFWCDQKKLDIQTTFLENHSEYIGVANKSNIVDQNSRIRVGERCTWEYDKVGEFTLSNFIESCSFTLAGQTASLLFKNVFRDRLYDYSILYKAHSMIGDRTLMFILLLQGKFFCMSEVMSSYRRIVNDNGSNWLSVSKSMDLGYENFKIIKCYETYAKSEFKQNINFYKYKEKVYFDAVCVLLQKKSIAQLKKVMFYCRKERFNFKFILSPIRRKLQKDYMRNWKEK